MTTQPADQSDQLTDDEIRLLLLSYALKEACDRLAKISSISCGKDDYLEAETRTLSESELYVSLLRDVEKLLYDQKTKVFSEYLSWDLDQLREAIPDVKKSYLWRWHND